MPPELLTASTGWQGGTPKTEGELIRAGLAEKVGRETCNGKLLTVAAILR